VSEYAPEVAVAIRPGEHACCRFTRAEDRRAIAAAFLRDSLRRGDKVIYLCEREDIEALGEELSIAGDEVGPAIESGQLEVRDARDLYTSGDGFDVDPVLRSLAQERERALAEGYPALSMMGEMSWALRHASDTDLLPEYERRVAEVLEQGNFGGLCQYDHARFDPGTLSDVAAAHTVDISPELAALVRTGCLAGARIDGRILRLSGELDFGCADALVSILSAHFHGPLELDLGDLDFVDVAGMRALRGRTGQRLTIRGASGAVRRLLALLAWDTDPGIEVLS
jgi:ABC-type transporter Mla MlaB component